MQRQGIVIILAAVVLAGCLSSQASDEKPEIDGFEVQELPYDGVKSVQEADGRIAFVARNETGDYLMHGERIVGMAPHISRVVYNGTTWAYATNGTANLTGYDQIEWQIHVGDHTSDQTYNLPFVEPAGDSWIYGGNYFGEHYYVMSEDRYINASGLNTKVIDGQLAYTRQTEDGFELVHGGEVVSENVSGQARIWNVDGDLAYSQKTDKTTQISEDYAFNRSIVHIGDETIGAGYDRVIDIVRGNDDRLYYVAENITTNRYDLINHSSDRVMIDAAIIEPEVRPYRGSIAYINKTENAVYGGGNRITYSDQWLLESDIEVLDGDLVYQMTNVSSDDRSEHQQSIVYGDRRIDIPADAFPVTWTAVDGRFVIYFSTDDPDGQYMAWEKQ